MHQRRFKFQQSNGGQLAITLACRAPPEEQAGRTLTWQIGDSNASNNGASEQPADAAGSAAPAAPASAAAAPDLIGLDIWPASIALCRYLAAHPQLTEGLDVLELGAGMGLVGLAAAALGARSVLLTDYEPEVLAHLASNASLNGLQQRCSCAQIDWRAPSQGLATGQRGSWRLVLAADVLYASVVVQPFIDTLLLALHPQGVALVGHQVRRAIVLDPASRLPRLEECDEPLERFKAACAAGGLAVRLLGSRQTCSYVDTDPMVLLAVGWPSAAEVLERLPEPAPNGGSNGSSIRCDGSSDGNANSELQST
ncbi:hypothetical protein ABPG75_008768 [Micractinium tetrahymenae]